MSTTKIYTDLFQNEGMGEVLRNDIIPVLPDYLYVNPANGNDDNDGFTAETAKKTLSAVDEMIVSRNYICPRVIGIRLAAGNYTGQQLLGRTNRIINFISEGGTCVFDTNTYFSDLSYTLMMGAFQFDGAQIQVSYGATLQLAGGSSYTFNNLNNNASFYVYSGGKVVSKYGSSISFNYTGTCSGNANFSVSYGSSVNFVGSETWTGSYTGKRYDIIACSLIRGAGSNKIPGSTAGTTDSTSYYN